MGTIAFAMKILFDCDPKCDDFQAKPRILEFLNLLTFTVFLHKTFNLYSLKTLNYNTNLYNTFLYVLMVKR